MSVRSAALCVALAIPVLSAAADAGLTQVRNIYLLPMSGGLDQYLADRLTAKGRYTVVTDPELADAVLTDRIGADFESRLAELYPPPEPPKEESTAKEPAREPTVAEMFGQSGRSRPIGSFTRGRGNIFLVDRSSKRVLWSTYRRPRGSRPDDVHRSAGEIVGRLDDAAREQVKQLERSAKQSAAPPATPAPAPAP